jgi:hypothetical protein
LRKTMERSPSIVYFDLSSYIYHFLTPSVRVHWNNRNRIELSFNELDKHHKLNIVTWSCGSSLLFPLKFSISKARFLGPQANSIYDESGHSSISTNIESEELRERVS